MRFLIIILMCITLCACNSVIPKEQQYTIGDVVKLKISDYNSCIIRGVRFNYHDRFSNKENITWVYALICESTKTDNIFEIQAYEYEIENKKMGNFNEYR